MTTPVDIPEQRVAPLDGLRAIAVLIVMVSHAGLEHIIPGGFGVTIFFFLSGYLITTLLRVETAKTGSVSLAGFYLRRTVRIIPPMMICIAVTVALAELDLLGRSINLDGLPLDILFLTNYADQIGVVSQIPIPLWSLDVEEHFYLVFPLVFIATQTGSIERTRNWIVLSLGAVLLLRTVLYFTLNDISNLYYWTHTRIDSILYGCLLAVWNNPSMKDRVRIGSGIGWLAFGVALILFCFVVRDTFFREVIRYSVQGLALLLVFNFVLRDGGLIAQTLSNRLLKIVGDYSYVLYLIHVPLLALATNQLTAFPRPAASAIGFILSFAFAAAMHRLVERPLMIWRKEFQKRMRLPQAALPKGVE